MVEKSQGVHSLEELHPKMQVSEENVKPHMLT